MSFSCQWFEVSDADEARFTETYCGVPVRVELAKMETWLWANPARRKKNIRRFIVNWLGKCHKDLLAAEVGALVKEDMRRRQAMVGEFRGRR